MNHKKNFLIVMAVILLGMMSTVYFIYNDTGVSEAQSVTTVEVATPTVMNSVDSKSWTYSKGCSKTSTSDDCVKGTSYYAENYKFAFTDPFKPYPYPNISTLNSKTVEKRNGGSCTYTWDYPGSNGATGDICSTGEYGPIATLGVVDFGMYKIKGHIVIDSYPVEFSYDANGVGSVTAYQDSDVTKDATTDLTVTGDPATRYSVPLSYSATYIRPYNQADPDMIAVNGVVVGPDVMCKYLSASGINIARQGWVGNNCIATAVVNGHSATDVTPSVKGVAYYMYDVSAGEAKAINKRSPSTTGASASAPGVATKKSKGMVASALSALLSMVYVAPTVPEATTTIGVLPNTETTTITLFGDGFDTSAPNHVLLTSISSEISTSSPVTPSMLFYSNLGANSVPVILDVYTDDPKKISFDVPTDLVKGYKVQVRTDDSDWSSPMWLMHLLNLQIMIPKIVPTPVTTTQPVSGPATKVTREQAIAALAIHPQPLPEIKKLPLFSTPVLSISKFSQSSIIFNWNNVVDLKTNKPLTRDKIKYSLVQITPSNKVLGKNIPSISAQVNNLKAQTSYCAVVVATDSKNISATSTQACVTTLPIKRTAQTCPKGYTFNKLISMCQSTSTLK